MAQRVLVVDDQRLFREAAASVVGMTPGFELMGCVDSGETAVAAVEAEHPDVVLLDVVMPGMGGIAAARAIVAASPMTAVVLLSTYAIEDLPDDARNSGAVAYVHKEEFGPSVLADVVAGTAPRSWVSLRG